MVVLSTEQKTEDIILRGQNFPVKQDCSLGKFILDKLTKHGDKISQIYSLTGESYTHFDIKKRSIQVAKELRGHGVGLGDVISICSANTPTSALPLLAGTYIGAAISPLDPSLNKFDIKHLMNITTPKIIFTEESCLKIIEEVIQELSLSTEIVVFGESNKHATFSQFLTPSIDEDDDFEPVNFTNPQDHIAFLMSSSGTTGLPKCVSLSHAAILLQLQLALVAQYPNDVTVLNMSSLFWITGVLVTLIAIAIGGTRILTPPFEPVHTLETIEKYKVPWIIVGVTFFARMVTHPKASEFDLSCVQVMGISGGKASDQHLVDGKKVFPRALLTSSYGLTETSGNVFKLHYGKPTAVGHLVPGVEAKVLDVESGASLGPNKKGELCFRGKLLFSGYYKNEKATNEAIDKDGWLHTGDLGYYDDEECFYVDGRIKEQFKCKGWQISPLELESVLLEHPAIVEAAVLGVPHKIDVARPKAFIVKRQNSEATVEEIHSYMKERMNPNKQITGGIVFVDTLPTTPTGKIQRRALVELAKKYLTDDE
ncbi:4-coumarate--CoA ligase 1-like isoform X3 [Chrysoperla carnea]|uniref:4-coumarate--CoA ligase 1-like isoform X3 n=1 Tax=Chrysoperla carnea TaxID=189513 RepID=UPI001D0833AE|nr:4-coumarate--CoA ligase 1-like isoform X3 [Chrysoperla carnea]